MSISDQDSANIKKQLLSQIEKLPQEQQEQARAYIESMNNEQLENFLKQNNMIQSSSPSKQSECVFCLIANKKVDAFRLYEDKDYLAALEINPFSKGHIILIPKKHIKEAKSLKSKAFTIANKIGRHLIKKLGAENFNVWNTCR